MTDCMPQPPPFFIRVVHTLDWDHQGTSNRDRENVSRCQGNARLRMSFDSARFCRNFSVNISMPNSDSLSVHFHFLSQTGPCESNQGSPWRERATVLRCDVPGTPSRPHREAAFRGSQKPSFYQGIIRLFFKFSLGELENHRFPKVS